MGFDTTHKIRISKENLDIDSLKTAIMHTIEELDDTLDCITDNYILNIIDNNDFYIIEETFNHWIFQSACQFCRLLSKHINSHIYLKSIDETDVIGTAVLYGGDILTSNIIYTEIEISQYEILIKGKKMKIQKYTVENNDRERAIETAIGIFKYHNSGVNIEKVWSKLNIKGW